MKTPSTKSEQKKISPLTMIIAGVGLIACIYLLLPSQPTPQPSPVNNNLSQREPAPLAPTGNPDITGKGSPLPKSPTVPAAARSQNTPARDPFFPAIGEAPRGIPRTTVPKFSFQPFPSAAEIAPIKEDDGPKPVWKGTIGSNLEQLVLISFRGKPYILRLGDPIPNSDYQVAEINADYLLLNSPKQSLRLYPKKEASDAKN